MFCAGCGKEIADNNKFCPHCGKKIEITESVNTFTSSGGQGKTRASAPKAPKVKKPFQLNKAMLAAFIEIVVLVLLIFGFFKLGERIFGPESVAKEYMRAYAEDDWDTIYSMTDVTESDFITEDSLKKALEERISDDFEDYDTSISSMRGGSAAVKVKYGEEGSLKNKLTLNMEKQGGKKFIFFDTWKVSTEDDIVSNPVIYVPTGTKAYFDGILISDEYLQEGYVPQSDYYYGYDGYDSYVLPKIYAGEHTVTAAIGEYPVASSSSRIDEENREIVAGDIRLPEELQETLVDTGYDYMQSYLEAKVEGKPFESIDGLYKNDRDILDSAKSNYEYSTDNYYAFNRETGVREIEVSDSRGRMNSFYLDNGTMTAQIQLDFNYDTTYVDKDWWSGEETERKNEDMSGSCVVYLSYTADDSWKLTNMQLPYYL